MSDLLHKFAVCAHAVVVSGLSGPTAPVAFTRLQQVWKARSNVENLQALPERELVCLEKPGKTLAGGKLKLFQMAV